MYKYKYVLNGLLERLDRIDSHGDAEVREKRKEVVKAVESALEEVECADGEAVEKRLSLAAPVHARYLLIWFTTLPPDTSGTYQASLYGITVQGQP